MTIRIIPVLTTPIQTTFYGSQDGSNTIYGHTFGDTIWGDAHQDINSGTIGNNTVYGGAGSNTIYGDCSKLHGYATANSNVIWGNGQGADYTATTKIVGNAVFMYGHAYAIGNSINDSFGGVKSTLFGNAVYMNQDAIGGHNTIVAGSADNTVYGTAQFINTTGGYNIDTDVGSSHAVHGGGNTIYLEIHRGTGTAYGDAASIEQGGQFTGGYNKIYINDYSAGRGTVYGTAGTFTELGIQAGHNEIHAGFGTDIIFGDCGTNNGGSAVGGYNTIYAGAGSDTIYGDCGTNTSNFTGGHNTIYAGHGDAYDNQGKADIWGSATDGFNTFLFQPGTGQVTIHDFNHHPGRDVLDVSAYHLTPVLGAGGVTISSDNGQPSGNAVVNLPSSLTHASQVTLIGIHPADLTVSDFQF